MCIRDSIYCAPEHSQWALDRLGELLRPLGLSEVVSKRQCFAPPAIRPRLPPALVQSAVCELGAGGPVVKCGVDSGGRVVAGCEAAVARGVLVARGMEVAGVPEGEPGGERRVRSEGQKGREAFYVYISSLQYSEGKSAATRCLCTDRTASPLSHAVDIVC